MAGHVDFKSALLYPWTSKMRVQGDHKAVFTPPRRAKLARKFLGPLGALALALGLVTSSGCAKRLVLTPGQFERIDKQEQATEALRVYVLSLIHI